MSTHGSRAGLPAPAALVAMDELDGLNESAAGSEAWSQRAQGQTTPAEGVSWQHQAWEEWGAASWSSRGWQSAGPRWKDSEPPPPYDGENPSETYQKWRRLYKLWVRTTDTPASKQGRRTLAVLSKTALTAVLTLPDEKLVGAQGPESIVKVLDDLYEPYADTRLARIFQKAVYGGSREKGESMMAYTGRKQAEFVDLGREGCELPPLAAGLVIMRQAKLNDRAMEDMAGRRLQRDDGGESSSPPGQPHAGATGRHPVARRSGD